MVLPPPASRKTRFPLSLEEVEGKTRNQLVELVTKYIVESYGTHLIGRLEP